MQYFHICIQEKLKSAKNDRKHYHCLAVIGHDFKSDINFYQVAQNINGKMSQQAYIDQILEPIINHWIDA